MGEEAVEEVRAKVRAFITDGRNDIDEREKFNQWFHSTGLVVVVDPRNKTCHIGTAWIENNRMVRWVDSEYLLERIKGYETNKKLSEQLLRYTHQLLENFRMTGDMVPILLGYEETEIDGEAQEGMAIHLSVQTTSA